MRESELVIMIAVRDRRDAWVGPSCLTRMDYEASLGWSAIFIESEMRSVPECMESYVQKTFDTVGIVREADLSPISVHVTVDWGANAA